MNKISFFTCNFFTYRGRVHKRIIWTCSTWICLHYTIMVKHKKNLQTCTNFAVLLPVFFVGQMKSFVFYYFTFYPLWWELLLINIIGELNWKAIFFAFFSVHFIILLSRIENRVVNGRDNNVFWEIASLWFDVIRTKYIWLEFE